MKKIRNKGITVLAILLMVMTFITGCTNKNIVAKVNDEKITTEEYNKQFVLIKKNYESTYGNTIWKLDVGGKTFLQDVQEKLLEKMIDDQVIIQYLKGKNIKIDQKEVEKQYKNYLDQTKGNKEFQQFLKDNDIKEDFIKDQIISDLYINNFQEMVIKELNIGDETLKKYYDQHIDEYRNLQVKASHILVKTEKEAKDLLVKIQSGEDFSELAKKYSIDPGTGTQGGDLGYFGKGAMVPEFDKVAFSLKVGEISQPVKTKYGYHIIKVTDKKDEMKKFEEVKEEIRGNIIDKGMIDKINKIKKNFKIEKFPENISESSK